MKDDPIDSLLDHDEDVPVPKEHEERIRKGLAPLFVVTTTAAATAAGTTAVATTSSATKAAGKAVLGKWIAVVAIAAGGGGFVAGRASAPPGPPAPPGTATPSTAAHAPKVTETPSSTSVLEVPSAPPAPSVSVAPSANRPAASENAFDREQSLLERARSALVRHDAAAAEAALDEADRQFPRSRHAEERDYLRIQTLREKGDLPGARVRARIFLTNYPDSLLRKRVEAVVSEP